MINEKGTNVKKRQEILDKAIEYTCADREDQYGSPEDNFSSIARLWTEWKGVKFNALDVSMMMALLKVARIKTGTGSEDSFIDLAGYAACAGEIDSKTVKASTLSSAAIIDGQLVSSLENGQFDQVGKFYSNNKKGE